jgi:hypothetical protein
MSKSEQHFWHTRIIEPFMLMDSKRVNLIFLTAPLATENHYSVMYGFL